MPLRVISLVLSVVLLWSGLGTIEVPRVFAQPSPERGQAIVHPGIPVAEHEGSVEHHHLDDLPAQAQSDPVSETPGVLPAPPTPCVPSVVTNPPRAFASAEAAPPFLAGLLRPPCGAALAG